MTNTHSTGPAVATLHFHIASSKARRTGLNAKVPDMMAEGAEQWGDERWERNRMREEAGESERGGRWWEQVNRVCI